MIWIPVLALIIFVNHVELKCGEFSNDKTLNELPSIILDTKIGQNVTIPLPKIYKKDITFVLTKPNGQQYLLNNLNYSNSFCNLSLISITNELRSRHSFKTNDKRIEKDKEIIIGPITEEDYGNWAVSGCYIEDDIDTEVFQVFSINIEEDIATLPEDTTSIHHHENMKIRLTRPIPGLKTCELIAPKSSPDRAFERDPEYLDSCGFVLKDVGVADAGVWRVVAVGDIVYVGRLEVMILEDS